MTKTTSKEIKGKKIINHNSFDKCKHFWLPFKGYLNLEDFDYKGYWEVRKIYCAKCLKVKEL
jgi:hypothetical protein